MTQTSWLAASGIIYILFKSTIEIGITTSTYLKYSVIASVKHSLLLHELSEAQISLDLHKISLVNYFRNTGILKGSSMNKYGKPMPN